MSVGNTATFRLCGFLLASLCAHATILLMLGWNIAADGIPETEPALSITLSLAKSMTSEPRTRSLPPRVTSTASYVKPKTRSTLAKPTTATPVQPHALEPAETMLPPQEPATKLDASPMDADVPDDEQTAPLRRKTADAANEAESGGQSAKARIQTLILTDLTRRFVYPELAQRRGWQGTVLLALTVDPNGALERIHVMQSSGYDLLDRSAVDTMRHVARITEAKRWLGGQALKLQMPIVYRLTK